MERFNKFLRRLFSLRNIAPAVIIIGAIIGSFGLTPFGIKYSSEQIILGLLAFLAIDSLVERLDLLAGIEDSINQLGKSLTRGKIDADTFFKKRSEYPRMEHLLSEAQKEIWIAGVTLDTVVTLASILEDKMRQKCKIRILALAPDGSAFSTATNYFMINPEHSGARIRSNLTAIASKLKVPKSGSFEFRLIDNVFSTGYVVADPQSSKARMIVQLYLYQTRTDQAPLFELSKAESPEWFAVYLRQYEEAWNASTKFEA